MPFLIQLKGLMSCETWDTKVGERIGNWKWVAYFIIWTHMRPGGGPSCWSRCPRCWRPCTSTPQSPAPSCSAGRAGRRGRCQAARFWNQAMWQSWCLFHLGGPGSGKLAFPVKRLTSRNDRTQDDQIVLLFCVMQAWHETEDKSDWETLTFLLTTGN